MSRVLAALATFAIVASSFAFTSNVALGHEHRSVGPYTFVVGWINEPAYVNAANGVSLDVSETDSSKPVEGLASTLYAEVIVGGGAKKRTLDRVTDEESPGHYAGACRPTKGGDYHVHRVRDAGLTKGDQRSDAETESSDA